MKHIKFLFISIITLALAACVTSKGFQAEVPANGTVYLGLVGNPTPNKYVNLDYGIRMNVKDGRSTDRILQKFDASAVYMPTVTAEPEVRSFVTESARRYMRTLGFNLGADVSTDYMLTITIKEYNLSYLSGLGWSSTVALDIEVHDHNRQLVYPNVTAIGRANINGSSNNYDLASQSINRAYANALEDIDWDRIAFFLKKASNPALEANKQVTGEGNTALESTIIRWYIESSPKGADVSTRVVSSTPEVKNTNQNYVGTTPYETTEAFDIKGLTFNNSGNVQIEVTCEKAGYMTQKKRFNLRQAIEQKEISTKFNLVKDE